jgi:zinc protease
MKHLVYCFLLITSISAQAATTIQHWVNRDGVLIYLVEAKTIPMVDVQVDWPVGSASDPQSKIGLASMTAALIDKGAVANKKVLTEAAIADKLADLGAVLSFSAGAERSSMRMRSLSDAKRVNELVSLTAQILNEPLFDSKVLSREKDRTIMAIKEAQIKPEVILSKEFDRQIYGSHPYGLSASVATVQSITQKDVKDFYFNRYSKKGVKVSIVGDIDKASADHLVEKVLAGFPKEAKITQSVPEVSLFQPNSSKIIKIPHAAQQAHISMGMPTIARKNSDYFPMLVGNYILGGGGFVSRLVKEVREKRGLAYSVYSYVSPGRQIGPYVAGMQTQQSQADLAVDVMKKTISEFIEHGPTDEEMNAAKDNLINGFPLRIDSNRKILDNVASIAWNDLPLDTLDTWRDQLKAVTKEQVKKAFKTHLDMNRMVTVVVGAP